MKPLTKEGFILSILNAWKKDGTDEEVPWHITDLGWQVYTKHPDPMVRKAAYANPFHNTLSKDLQAKRKERILSLRK
jgi:hypothetical protein